MESQLILNGGNGIEFLAKGNSGHQITIGFSKDIGGKDNGPSPMELLLHGTAGCTGIDILLILKKMKATVSSFEIKIDGERADNHPRRFVKIKMKYFIKGQGLTEKNVKRAIELSQEKYCSASNSLNAEITYTYDFENI